MSLAGNPRHINLSSTSIGDFFVTKHQNILCRPTIECSERILHQFDLQLKLYFRNKMQILSLFRTLPAIFYQYEYNNDCEVGRLIELISPAVLLRDFQNGNSFES